MPVVNPTPETYPRVTPHLSIAGAADAVDFYTSVLGASERMRMAMPDGTIAHAEIEIGGSVIMIGDEQWPGGKDPSPTTLGGSPVALFVYVEDVDKVFKRAVEKGAVAVPEPEDHFYGDRVAMFDDPYGHRWNLGTHIEDVPPEEMERRFTEELERRGAEAMSGA
jgi:PhnB protein